jgi:hypothetical protein
MWTDTPFEKHLKAVLKKAGARGEVLSGIYVASKQVLAEGIYEEIKMQEPDLSDHGPRHIANVFENISALLGSEISRYSPEELYCLGMITLFHDVGNIYGRKRHNEKIKAIYTKVRSGPTADRGEMLMVLQAAKAHTGEAADGSKDTLQDLDNNTGILSSMSPPFIWQQGHAAGSGQQHLLQRRQGSPSRNSRDPADGG